MSEVPLYFPIELFTHPSFKLRLRNVWNSVISLYATPCVAPWLFKLGCVVWACLLQFSNFFICHPLRRLVSFHAWMRGGERVWPVDPPALRGGANNAPRTLYQHVPFCCVDAESCTPHTGLGSRGVGVLLGSVARLASIPKRRSDPALRAGGQLFLSLRVSLHSAPCVSFRTTTVLGVRTLTTNPHPCANPHPPPTNPKSSPLNPKLKLEPLNAKTCTSNPRP